MKKLSKSKSRAQAKIGLPPGSLVYVGEQKTDKVRLSIMEYGEEGFSERQPNTVEECFPLKPKPGITWLNVDGLHDVSIMEAFGKQLNIHPLALEDIISTGQRPKVEDYGEHLFIVLKMLYSDSSGELVSEQVSLVMGENYVLSFQEKEGDVFELIRKRIRGGKGRIRRMGADYLAYALMDAIVDNYFVLLEAVGLSLEELENGIVENPTPENLQKIHNLKRQMIQMRKAVWPLREVIGSMERSESSFVSQETSIFLRDLYDHTIQVIETMESYRDMASGMTDLYMSSVSNRMNEVMKVLTIIATIFIPLTFIAGIYGMNFDPDVSPLNMPELKWVWGYPAAIAAMTAVALAMVAFFKKKGWL
ncbi:MAG: magnesium/cobalt transporter CorA [Candidatus Thermoplasmatota archaeon]|nr:magnesium/cobalt transporter CorA [Candidatus Thermoplasmatota archaeon]